MFIFLNRLVSGVEREAVVLCANDIQRRARYFLYTASIGAVVAFSQFAMAAVPALSVDGNKIKANGQTVSFSGMSMFWSNEGWGAEKFYTTGSVVGVKNFFGGNLVRAAMGVEDDGGYIVNPAENENRVTTVVDAAIENDMYVIIDFHSHYAHQHQATAIAFFEKMARRYGNSNNVIYEIFNEPKNDVTWTGQVKPYAQAVVNAIRQIDPDNIIVIGSPNWSQDVDVATASPVSGNNLAYTLHFYAGTHGEGLRNKARTALDRGYALFVTEWGTVNADGDGGVAQAEADRWLAFMQENDISNANWALNDKTEGASVFWSGTSGSGNWSNSDLTPSGSYVKNLIQGWGGGSSTPTPTPTPIITPTATPQPSEGFQGRVDLPGRIEAEHYYTSQGETTPGNANQESLSQCVYYGLDVDVQNASEGTCNVGWTAAGEKLTYRVGSAGGSYDIRVRLASVQSGRRVNITVNDGFVGQVSTTGDGWQAWSSEAIYDVTIANNATVQLDFLDGDTNVDYIDIQPGGGSSSSSSTSSGSSSSSSSSSNSSSSGGGLGQLDCVYSIASLWESGFTAEISLTNTSGISVNDWTVNWAYSDGSVVIDSWNANVSGSGPYSASNLSWNANIAPGATVSFGVMGSHNGVTEVANITGPLCN